MLDRHHWTLRLILAQFSILQQNFIRLSSDFIKYCLSLNPAYWHQQKWNLSFTKYVFSFSWQYHRSLHFQLSNSKILQLFPLTFKVPPLCRLSHPYYIHFESWSTDPSFSCSSPAPLRISSNHTALLSILSCSVMSPYWLIYF